uniref:Uncharacterized protein n=1 Tax=Trypanosoma congolense (strain IL3000) TaxID=1068625 RepID=G0UPA8_TRYCI|nr:conserved hypothetical protein [Trypanosoma congolense IL3000]
MEGESREHMQRRSLPVSLVLSIAIALGPFVTQTANATNASTASDSDKALSNTDVFVYACIVKEKPTNFNADTFNEKTLQVLNRLPKDVFNDSSQLELLEYCGWANSTVNYDSYCRAVYQNAEAGVKQEKTSQTLARFSVAGVDKEAMQKADFSSLNLVAPPLLQVRDPAFYPLRSVGSFIEDLMDGDSAFHIVALGIILTYPISLVFYLFVTCRSERTRDRRFVESLQQLVSAKVGSGQFVGNITAYVPSQGTADGHGECTRPAELQNSGHNKPG